jgi:uncharacterized protein (DUF2267 family)
MALTEQQRANRSGTDLGLGLSQSTTSPWERGQRVWEPGSPPQAAPAFARARRSPDPRSQSEATRSPAGSDDPRGLAQAYRTEKARGLGVVAAPLPGTSAAFFRAIERSGALPRGLGARAAAAAVLTTMGLLLDRGIVQTLQECLPAEYAGLLAADPDLCPASGPRFRKEELIRRVAEQLSLAKEPAEAAACAVLRALRSQIPEQQAESLAGQVPAELVRLWHGHPRKHRIASAAGGWSRPGWPYSL